MKGESKPVFVDKNNLVITKKRNKRGLNSAVREIRLNNDYSHDEDRSRSYFVKEVKHQKGELGKDEPQEIVNVGRIKKSDKELYCEIKWKRGINGIQKENSIFKTRRVKELYPKMLVDFYESKIVFLKEFH